MLKYRWLAIVGLLTLMLSALFWTMGLGPTASPPAQPLGLERAIAAQEKHNPQLLAIPGVVGTAVGLAEKGNAAVVIFTERAGVHELPATLDGVPVVVRVSGKFVALPAPPRNRPPVVTISSPAEGATFGSGATILFEGKAADREDGDLTAGLSWISNIDGVIGSGGSFSRSLSDGNHTITAAVSDSGGKTGSDSVSITVGKVLTPRDRWPRPVPIGVSTGHPNITAGTIGARVKDAAGKVYALSNNHVYADENRAQIGDNALQPGPYDGGKNPDDAIGTLHDYQPIVFTETANNVIDAAIAISSVESLGKATPPDGYGTPLSATTSVYLNQRVKKYGRTTGLTTGAVYAINATVNIGYGTGVARFVNQIVITPGTFSAGGDSGSLIVVDGKGRSKADDRKPIGLLFAGSQFYTIANPIGAVLARFGVTVDGE